MTGRPRRAFRKQVGDYYLGRTIGEGAYAKVKYGEHVETGERVAIKILNKKDIIEDEMVEQIKREIAITKELKHPNVVDLIEVMASKDKIYMVMELLTGGELFDQIAAEGAMGEHKARKVFQQLLDALDYCHQEGVFHRDLKPENVLLSSDGTVKLSDFGLGAATVTQSMSADGFLRTTCGTPNYVAPEVLKRHGYHGAPADIWSLGVVLYVTVVGKLPFDDRSLPRLFHKITMADFDMPSHLTPELQDLLKKLMLPDPQKRITVPEIRCHSWVDKDYVPAIPKGSFSLPNASEAEDIFLETVELKHVEIGKKSADAPYSPPPRRNSSQYNAFHLIGTALDLSNLFESRKEVIQRNTRFTCYGETQAVLQRIGVSVSEVGGRVEPRGGDRLKLFSSNQAQHNVTASAEVFDLLPGIQVVEIQRSRGDRRDFREFYAAITTELHDLITPRRTVSCDGRPLSERPCLSRRGLSRPSTGSTCSC